MNALHVFYLFTRYTTYYYKLVARLRNKCNFIFFNSGISFLVFNQNNLKEGPHLHKNEVLLICHDRKKIYLSFSTLFLYTLDFVLFLNKYLEFPCFKCLK